MYREDFQESAPQNVASFASLNWFRNNIMIETTFYFYLLFRKMYDFNKNSYNTSNVISINISKDLSIYQRLILNLFSIIKIINVFRTFAKPLLFIRSVYGNWIQNIS